MSGTGKRGVSSLPILEERFQMHDRRCDVAVLLFEFGDVVVRDRQRRVNLESRIVGFQGKSVVATSLIDNAELCIYRTALSGISSSAP